MRITVERDHEHKVAYISLTEGRRHGLVARSVVADGDFVLDFDEHDNLVGIECLDVRRLP